MEHDVVPCFECFERQIHADFSPELVVRYGISESPLPFGSSAVVQLNFTKEEDNGLSENVSSQFVLVGLPNCKFRALERNNLPSCSGYKSSENHQENTHSKDNSVLEEGLVVMDCHTSSVSTCPQHFISRMISKLTPVAYVGRSSYAIIRSLALKHLTGEIEENVITSINALLEDKMSEQHGADFLKLIGYPALGEGKITSCLRHPNISPILGILEAPAFTYLLHPKAPYTLDDILKYSPKALKSDWIIRFLTYQILSAIGYIHDLGISHGNITPSSIVLNDSLWMWLNTSQMYIVRHNSCLKVSASASTKACCTKEKCPCRSIYADNKLSISLDWFTSFKRWWTGELSNYEYLLLLNKLAGRRWGDHRFHTVMPWVIDFTLKPNEDSDAGWRDLTKSKWRLAKGDEQLDFTYFSSEIPHHVSDECLSELAVCSYKARRLPLTVLRSAVRAVYEPNEYPSNMQRLYQWTPDECIPEFYSDPHIFTSIHPEMCDLALPSWSTSPEEFISLHRDALESERVSRDIHHWIDITFGYKLSGEASIAAKNVMLPSSDPSMPKSIGRRQLFTKPHPRRRGISIHSQYHGQKESCFRCQVQQVDTVLDPIRSYQLEPKKHLLSPTGYMEDLEEADMFAEGALYLDPIYNCQEEFDDKIHCLNSQQNDNSMWDEPECSGYISLEPSDFGLVNLIECFEADDTSSMGFQEHLIWRLKSTSSTVCSEDHAKDIFSFGCILAELYLRRPLFDPLSFAAYEESGILPIAVQELPPHVAFLVEASIHRDWMRRPSAKCLLESEYFSPTIRSAYLFLAPLQLLAKTGQRLQYAAKLAGEGALKTMGEFSSEMCASYCLPLILSSLSDIESEAALGLLKEFLKILSTRGIRTLIFPIIQKILQDAEYSHLKVSLVQDSFIRDLWKRVGKQAYLEKIHPLVMSNLVNLPNKIVSSASIVALIGSSEELGFPITLHQTVLPLVQYFGKGLSAEGIEALVRIGSVLGETFVSKQLLPLLRNAIQSSLDVSQTNKPEPLLCWSMLTLIDSFSLLDSLVSVMSVEFILKELIPVDQTCLHVKVLMQIQLDIRAIQAAATTLVELCRRIGPDFTALYVMPQLKDLFNELAFPHLTISDTDITSRKLKLSKPKVDQDIQIENRMDLVLLLYPFFASFIGIERLRRCCSSWFLLEQILQRYYNWKWDLVGETSRSNENISAQRLISSNSSSEYNPAKLLLNGVGWSIPQSQSAKSGTTVMNSKNVNERQPTEAVKYSETLSFRNHEPWFWLPTADAIWDGPEFLGRQKDELPWKIKASILYSARAHPGAVRSMAVCNDESTVYTAGVGPGFKGSVQKWELARMNCISGYYGHDEVVNAICTLSVSGKIASCDGTIHVWNGQTGKLITAYAESSVSVPLPTTAKVATEQTNMLTPNALTNGILSNAFSGSLYTCMLYLDFDNKLVAGLGNGSLRFIDVVQDRKLQLWRNDAADYSLSSLVSAICSCGSENLQTDNGACSPWFAAGLSSGSCRLLDSRCGDVISHWKAHDGYITKLAAPEDYLLVSSSFDKTLRVWDLRRNLDSQSNVFRGHADGITSFALWGQDVISLSRNKIALTSLSKSRDEIGGVLRLVPQTLFSADRGMRNQSVLSTISILPFSRLFIVGTEDGYLKICC